MPAYDIETLLEIVLCPSAQLDIQGISLHSSCHEVLHSPNCHSISCFYYSLAITPHITGALLATSCLASAHTSSNPPSSPVDSYHPFSKLSLHSEIFFT